MNIKLKTGDKVRLIQKTELFTLLKHRNFCSDDATREKIANEIGGMKGFVYSIEDKWAFDYFYFCPDPPYPGMTTQRYSIPYQAVEVVLKDNFINFPNL